ncbi:MAG: alkaline phosphatase family protein [candidate division KSB1 bacterium]|nr:alkaline phosphatase family protein [candidate division KSB1 bacterium]MDZ7304582.1 alkaline phosphatase family protein [candidate division KSB1 bacterium]MDZ7313623.1 alkaline phosphatase family protein [candidate division KSB1 bacterium]
MKNPLVIIYLVDGARPDVMRELLENGDLPNIHREIVEPGTFRTASSCFPSTTGPAYLPFLAGCFPGTMNIPGIRWLDKAEFHDKRWGKNSFRSYMGYEAQWFNDDLPKDRPILYELFQRPFNIYSMITRGLPKGHNLTRSTKLPLYFYAHVTDHWKPVDKAAHHYLMRALDLNPDFIFAVFPGVDSYSHLKHPRHAETIAAYRYVDFSIGQVVEKLKRLGRWDSTLLIITSDHGLTATHEHFDLALYLQNCGMKTLYYPIVWKVRPKASVMISGNSAGLVYYLDGKNGAPLVGEQIKAALGEHWDELLARKEIDFIAYRHGNDVYEIASGRGHALIVRQSEGWCYLPQDGDPFGLGKIAQPLDRQQALETTFDSDYPDALVQIEQFFSCSRSGDLVVTARNGYDLRKAFEWPEHHSSHGSLHREHMIVPLIYNQTGWHPRPARTADLFNTILKWAGKPTLENTDGQPLC